MAAHLKAFRIIHASLFDKSQAFERPCEYHIYEGDLSANSALVDLPPKSLKLGPESR